MNAKDLFSKIQPLLMQRTIRKFALIEDESNALQSQFQEFFNSLMHSLVSGDIDKLRKTIDKWLDLEKNSQFGLGDRTLVNILIILQSVIYDVAEEELDNDEYVYLLKSSLPIFSETIDYTAEMEQTLQVELATKELDRAHRSIERIEKNKSDFISIAAHELKTPLTLIEGYAAMLQDQLDELNILDQFAVLLKGINKGATRLREIVNDMIDASMIDNEMLSLNFQPVWINRLFPLLEQEFRSKVAARKQSLNLNPFPRQLMTYADEERLIQAVSYIVSNAIKFTPDGGKITVDGALLPGFAEFSISDTGIGIDPGNHKKIFEKFSSLGPASLHSSGKIKFKGGGPGLGLPITKGIIEAHGGAIWVESDGYDEEKCPGTTFHVVIPIREQPPFEAHTHAEHNRTHEDVLESEVIDKSESIRQVKSTHTYVKKTSRTDPTTT
jgi:signal transduction histidine kinase